ncbi:MAG TPA: hypothetical protein VG758_09920 [Hyphomicrobiaceae bacterium]|jgi:hypothetical protein|nr:hypothetical protein [Hyphomicrobiaceae bacterium]
MPPNTTADQMRLSRLAGIADELAVTHPKAHDLVREVFALAASLLRDESKPRSIEVAPKHPEGNLLLYCPSQGGWRVGECLAGRWVESWTLDILHPTHWTEIPAEPEEVELESAAL